MATADSTATTVAQLTAERDALKAERDALANAVIDAVLHLRWQTDEDYADKRLVELRDHARKVLALPALP